MTSAKRPKRVPGQSIACGWCGRPIPVGIVGRLPKWCSGVCRHRAWEQRRAAASGRAAVEVVDRVVQVEKQVVITQRVEVPVAPKRGDWPALLRGLAQQIDAGRVYDRDLRLLAEGLNEVLASLDRPPSWQRLIRQHNAVPWQ